MPAVHGTLTDDEFVAFSELARDRGMTRSQLVSELCRKEIVLTAKKEKDNEKK